jgi:hypothetical protein
MTLSALEGCATEVVAPQSVRTNIPPTDAARTQEINPRWVYWSAGLAAVGFLMLMIANMNFCDPDVWHEMSLFREALAEGRVPTEDHFAYTPTVSPSIHHEWGTGAILYAVMTTFGGPGMMILKYSLVAAVAGLCYWCARRRGASAATFLWVAPAMAPFASYGFATIRAQLFTLAFLAGLLCLLEIDRRGKRWWIAVWLPMYVVWLNLHAGFAVGAVLLGLYACEQAARRQPFWHLVPVGAAMAGLVFVNPYGVSYVPYLLHGLTMDRPLIVEWQPLWRHDARVFVMFVASLLPIGYAIRQVGLPKLGGILLLAATAYAALRHTRHLSLYCVVWACYVPGYLQMTNVGAAIDRTYRLYGRLVMQASAVVAILCLGRSIPNQPWRMTMPASLEDAKGGGMCYPIGAIQFLDESGFRGNLMLPFETGGYAIWKLDPKVKVSIDGRYEVAYQSGVLEDHVLLYEAQSGWRNVLTKYPTDALIVPSPTPLAAAMPSLDGWKKAYDDGIFAVYVRLHDGSSAIRRSSVSLREPRERCL